MRIPLVWYNLIHDKSRTAVGATGVAFASILMFMQLGFLGALRNTATSILERLDFDILLVSPTYLYLYDTGTFPRSRLEEAVAVRGVTSATPLYLGFNSWSWRPTAAKDAAWKERAIFVIGFRPPRRPFRRERLGELKLRAHVPARAGDCLDAFSTEGLALLQQPDTLLIDRLSHPDFGPLRLIDPCSKGEDGVVSTADAARKPDVKQAEIVVGSRLVSAVGDFVLPTGFGADGAILVGDQNFSRLFGGRSLDQVSLGLIETSGDPKVVAADLSRYLEGDDVRVFTRAEVLEMETRYWMSEKALGVIFELGFIVACVVGVVFVYQILSSDITNRFVEYATLKAMGHTDWMISFLVIQQALILAVAGYVPAVIVSMVLADIMSQFAHLEIEITRADMISVGIFSTLICSFSAVIAIGKVRRADPADLF